MLQIFQPNLDRQRNNKMQIQIISFTERGIYLSKQIAQSIGNEVELFTKCSKVKEDVIRVEQDKPMSTKVYYVAESIGEWTKKQMEEKKTLLFIGACGIAVRAIAPYLTDKLQDNAVLVMDECGNYVIPILSGHIGGANEIAREIAEHIGAIPVITTATDLNRKFSVDLFAKRNGLFIANKEGIAKVSSKILARKVVTMVVRQGHLTEDVVLPEGIKILSDFVCLEEQAADIVIDTKEQDSEVLLWLRPKEYIIGIGCKRGKEEEKINSFIRKKLEEQGILMEQIAAVASIDKKKDEQGIVAWCRKNKIPFLTFTSEQLQQIKGEFSSSDFVKEQMGVDNVCERAALCACEYGGLLICKKYAEEGMTIAIAKREWRLVFDEK